LSEYATTISTAAVAGGCIGGVLLAAAISYYLYKAKAEKAKAPTIHMYSENESGDFIPFTADTAADVPQADQDQKCDFTIIYPIAQE
jgi:poly(3-hydroxyalkanoate) synthetase